MSALHHTVHEKHKGAGSNEVALFPSHAIVLPSIYTSGSLAHQRGIWFTLADWGENVILLYYVYMSARVSAALGTMLMRNTAVCNDAAEEVENYIIHSTMVTQKPRWL